MSTTSDEESLVEGTDKGNEYLQSLKELIPLYRGLDKSFWDQGPFLRWQLVRLNGQYQKDVDMLWTAFRSWVKNRPNRKERDLRDIETIQKEFLPDPGQTLRDWQGEFFPSGKYGNYSDIYERHILIDPERPWEDKPPVFWHGPLLKAEVDPDGDVVIAEMQTAGKLETVRINPATLGSMRPPPIPWQLHFPHEFLLNKLPHWPEEGMTKRGRPQDWALNLLVYELSKAGAKSMEIASLLFDAKKSTETYLSEHQILVRIATIKKTIHKAVSSTYPIPQSSYT